MFRKLYLKWLVWRGKALDIWSSNGYPSNVLSNLCSNRFYFDGVFCHSMEGFLQSLKYEDCDVQRRICAMKGRRAKNMSTSSWQTDQVVWWKGVAIDRHCDKYQDLLRRAYKAMFEQNERFRVALMSTRGLKLYHSRGVQNPYKTILTEKEFCSFLTEIRDNYDMYKNVSFLHKKRLYFAMDGVLADFASGLAQQSEHTLKEYEGRYGEIPGLFASLQPMSGAIDAARRLSEHYDCYILSTAPWGNPSAWSDKVSWVAKYFDDVFRERVVFTHCKNICKGEMLIDVCDEYLTNDFEGELIELGSEKYSDWSAIVDYLLPKQQ